MKNCRCFLALRDEVETTRRLKFPAIRLLTFLFAAALLSGCVRDESIPDTGTGRVLTVNYSFDNLQTRVLATGRERVITDVAVLFYNADDADPANETYVDCQAATIPGSNTSGSFPLALPATIIPGYKYRLIIIGNYKKYAPESKSPMDYAGSYNTRTYSEMKEKIQGELAPKEIRVTTPLPLWGKLLGADGNETTLTGPAAMDTSLGVSVKFSRSVTRLDVTNLAADQLKIAWVKVCNYRNKGYFFDGSIPPGNIVRGTAIEIPGLPFPPGYVVAPPPAGVPGSLRQNLNTGGLYAFPNTVSYTSQDDKLTTCLMIAGYFKEKGAANYGTKLTYYRANMSENGNSQILRCNYLYTLVINNVRKEGNETEEGAMNEKEQLLGYEVGDDLDSDDGSTVTDEAGNFLTLSRTLVVLRSEKDKSPLIKVAVKKGTGWEVEWKNNTENAFRFEKVNDGSFSIVTTGKNETGSTRHATLIVSVTGISGAVSTVVNVIQLPSDNDPRMLTVEGKMGAFEYSVPGQGAEISLQVVTGSPTSKWKAEADDNLKGCVNFYTPTGANGGSINLSFNANGGSDRSGILTVRRLLTDGSEDISVAPVNVTFKQTKSPYMVSLLPNYSANGLTIEGFSDAKGNVNGIAKNIHFNVLLADPVNYNFEATCSFNQNSDAFLTLTNMDTQRQAGPLQTSRSAPSTVEGIHGDAIWLNVFRTGPGDADITGRLIVKAVPKVPASGLAEGIYSVNITIRTSCKIGDSKTGTVLWADRNVGATSRGDGGTIVGLNYTNDVNSDDHANDGFKGTYYTFPQVDAGACESFGRDNRYEGHLKEGWRVANSAELNSLVSSMRFSKQRAFIVSDDITQGKVGCWFPLAGSLAMPDAIYGYFWSSVPYTVNAYYFYLDTGSTLLKFNPQSEGYSVRCVR